MVNPGIRWFSVVVTCAAFVGYTEDASAFHHHRRHGSWGSHGSSGSSGSSGSWGSSGSSGSSGSWGSHGSSGSSGSWGSSGSSGSSGSWGSHGSSGSSGGAAYALPAPVYTPVMPATPATPPAVEAPPMPSTMRSTTPMVMVVVNVPEDATVYFSGRKMVTPGATRRYLIPVPKAGTVYEYPIKVEVVRNGITLVSETKHQVQTGKTLELTLTESTSPDGIAVVQR